jgi:choline dehydrogenase-like flavoprotein
LTRSFVHLDHFTFDGKIPIIFRILRRIGKENFYFARKKSGSFDLNIFTEKTNEAGNEIRLSKGSDFTEYIDIDFYINSSEIELLKFCGEYWAKVIVDFLGKDFQKKQYLFNDNDIKSKIHAGSHPSGTYRMSSKWTSGIVNEKSELWQDNRIRVLGSGVYPIASVTHPTYTSLILALLGVSSDTSSI